MAKGVAPQPAERVRLYRLGEEGVLFDEAAQTLYRLNAAAALLWCRLEKSLDDVPVLTPEEGAALAEWRRLGLLMGGPPAPAPAYAEEEEADEGVCPVAPPAAVRRYRLLDGEFSVGFPSTVLEALVHPALAHLETATPAGPATRLDLVPSGWDYVLLRDGRPLGGCGSAAEIAPLVKAHLATLALQRRHCLLALHAGAATAPPAGGAVLLPGAPGSGKSTLTAALVGAGWRYLSDDTVLLEERTLAAVPVPYSLTIKEGAWELLASRFPALAGLAVHVRGDGQRVRYLPPPKGALAGPDPVPVRCVVFPCRGPVAPAATQRLSAAAGLERLLANCSALPGQLDAEKVGSLVRWAADIAWLEIPVADLDEAVARIATACATPG